MHERLNFVQRISILTALVERIGEVGRTSLMKLAYLLQTVKQVPLGYRFQLYLYGPYDPQVLSDVATAEAWGALHEEYYSCGSDSYGYKIRPAEGAPKLIEMEQQTVNRYRESIDWAVREFGHYNAAQMELIATLVWIDRELAQHQRSATLQRLVEIAHELKPHFSKSEVRQFAENLLREGIFHTVQDSVSDAQPIRAL